MSTSITISASSRSSPVKLVVPLTGWNASYRGKIWLVEIEDRTGFAGLAVSPD